MSESQVTSEAQLDTTTQTETDPLSLLSSLFDDDGNLLDDPKKEQEDTPTDQKEEAKDAEPKEETPAEPKHKVKVNGEEYEVELSELIKGYQREADYTRKTMTLAEERNLIAKTKEELAQTRTQAQMERDLTAKAINEVLATAAFLDPVLSMESQIDWNKLAQENPGEYVARKADLDQRKSQLNTLHTYLGELEKQRVAEFNQLKQAKIEEEYKKLTEVIPEFADKDKGAELNKEMTKFLNEVGFNNQELANVIDHRMFVVIKKALLYDKAMKQRANKAQPDAQPLQKGGVATHEAEISSERVRGTVKKFQKTGNLKDGAEALIAMGIV